MAHTQFDRRKLLAAGLAFGVTGTALGLRAVLAHEGEDHDGTPAAGVAPGVAAGVAPGVAWAAGLATGVPSWSSPSWASTARSPSAVPVTPKARPAARSFRRSNCVCAMCGSPKVHRPPGRTGEHSVTAGYARAAALIR